MPTVENADGTLTVADGTTDHPKVPQREIVVSTQLTGRELLEVLIHEFLHASFWELSEERVDNAAKDITTALWKLNFRQVDQ